MKTLGVLSFGIVALLGLSQPLQAEPTEKSEGYYFPTNGYYDSLGSVPTVRLVQLALREDGYYVGDVRGNYCYETRVAVRRYQRDNGLQITGRIDDTLLRTLRLR